jgi:hypothetical protein
VSIDAGAEPLRFVILCLGRTGSTHLQSMLDFHSQARCHGEIFGDGKPPTFADSDEDDPKAFLDRMLAGSGERAVGFKLPMNSIRLDPAVAPIVAGDAAIAAIRLSRRNRLAQLVSRQLLATTGVSQSIFGSYGDATVRLEPRACIAALDQIAADEAELDGLCEGHPIFRIAYEVLADEPRIVELQRFLGLDPEPLRSWFERLRTRPLSETVSNWDEITTALTGGPYEGFLEADG